MRPVIMATYQAAAALFTTDNISAKVFAVTLEIPPCTHYFPKVHRLLLTQRRS